MFAGACAAECGGDLGGLVLEFECAGFIEWVFVQACAAFRQAEQSWDAAFLDANGNRADQASAPEMIAIVAKGLGVSEDVVKLGLPYFDPQARVSVADVQGALDWYHAQGMIKTHIDAKKITDFRYAIEAPATKGGGRSGTASK